MTIDQAVKTRILAFCEDRNITLNKLGNLSGVTQSTISNIFGRNQSVKVSTIQKLCDGLDITIADFFDDDMFRHIEQEIR